MARRLPCACVLAALAFPGAGGLEAQTPAGSAFTYQGRLDDGGSPANGAYDFELRLFAAAIGGSPVGGPLSFEDVAVTGGLFTLSPDFGGTPFAGEARWLEVGVRPGASAGAYTALDPRQRLTAAPYALHALSIPLAGNGSATDAARSDHDHVGQTWAAASEQYGLQVTSSSTTPLSAALRGFHNGAGSYGAAVMGVNAQAATGAVAVVGMANHASAINRGVIGNSASIDGTGVYGVGTATSGTTYGVFGSVNSPSGWGLFTPNRAFVGDRLGIGSTLPAVPLDVVGQGRFSVPTGTPPLVVPMTYAAGATATNLSADLLDGLDSSAFAAGSHDHVGQTWSATGGPHGLKVTNSSTTGSVTGVRGESAADLGTGVVGNASSEVGVTFGVQGWADSILGTGVLGTAFSPTGVNYGVVGRAHSVAGRGVQGEAMAATGETYGVYGTAVSPDGWGLYTPNRAYVGDRLGIGLPAPTAPLDVAGQGTAAARFNRNSSDGAVVNIAQDGVVEGSISVSGTTVSYNAFTGSHYAWTAEPVARGLLVSFSGDNRTLHGRKGAEPVYGVARTERTNDPSVLGVYLGRLEPHQTDQPVTENPHLVAAVGNAELWVVDTGADVAPGDDLVASAVPGHAMKDAGEFERSHVVAKAAEPIRWKDVTETIAGRRHRRISVLLGAFTREGTRALASALAERETELLALRRRFDAVAAAVERLEALLLREAAGPPRATKLRTR